MKEVIKILTDNYFDQSIILFFQSFRMTATVSKLANEMGSNCKKITHVIFSCEKRYHSFYQ